MLTDFRCTVCNKLLGKIDGEAQIKCPRCNTVNYANVSAAPENITRVNPEVLVAMRGKRNVEPFDGAESLLNRI